MTDTVPDRAEITAALSAQWDELTRPVDEHIRTDAGLVRGLAFTI